MLLPMARKCNKLQAIIFISKQDIRTRTKCPGRVADILEACGALDPSSILGRDVNISV